MQAKTRSGAAGAAGTTEGFEESDIKSDCWGGVKPAILFEFNADGTSDDGCGAFTTACEEPSAATRGGTGLTFVGGV
jgi:hypothetical protein